MIDAIIASLPHAPHLYFLLGFLFCALFVAVAYSEGWIVWRGNPR